MQKEIRKANVYCEHCAELIESKDDLIVVLAALLYVAPFHAACYAKELKGVEGLFIENYPLNGIGSTILTVIGTVMFVVLFVIMVLGGFPNKSTYMVLVVLLLQIAARFYSWYAYERHLP